MPTRQLRIYSKTTALLLALADVIDASLDAIVHARAAARYGSDYHRVLSAHERAYTRRDLARLQDRRLVKAYRDGDDYRYMITEKGKIESCRVAVLKADVFEDGRMTMVVFDIPEEKRRERKMLRNFLSSAGFIALQKSVWISPFNAVKELERLFVVSNVLHWVRVFCVAEQEYSIK